MPIGGSERCQEHDKDNEVRKRKSSGPAVRPGYACHVRLVLLFEAVVAMPLHELGMRPISGSTRHDRPSSLVDQSPNAVRSFTWRETRISRSSARPTRPRSNIQCAVPESAIPLVTMSGPLASTGRICAAATSARPLPLINFKPVTAQRSSYARRTTRRNTRSRTIRDVNEADPIALLLELKRRLVFMRAGAEYRFIHAREERRGVIQSLLDNTVEVAARQRPDRRLSAPRYATLGIEDAGFDDAGWSTEGDRIDEVEIAAGFDHCDIHARSPRIGDDLPNFSDRKIPAGFGDLAGFVVDDPIANTRFEHD